MPMESRLPRLVVAATMALLMFSSLVAAPTRAQVAPPAPIWVAINATAQGNYPGGDELFTVFAVNSMQPPAQDETITDMTLSGPAAIGSNGAFLSLPATMAPGQSVLWTIHLPIPANFSQKTFTANLVVHFKFANGTALSLTGSADVDVLGLASQTSSQTQTTSQAAQAGTISTTLFAAGVAIPSLVAIVLLALLVQAKSKRAGA
jgi:hypothetical protein